MYYLGIGLSIISFILFYYLIKQEIICKCDEISCNCYTKKHKIAIKYGLVTSAFTFLTYYLTINQNQLVDIIFKPKTNLTILTS
jgi:hypothetical protein